MRSDLQIQASRANGSKSRGPVTEEGKLASSRNALKHGILSQIVLLPGEDAESFEADAVDLFAEHLPVGPTEEELVEVMAVARWRRMRIWNLEKACLTGQMEKEYQEAAEPKPDGGTTTALAFRPRRQHPHPRPRQYGGERSGIVAGNCRPELAVGSEEIARTSESQPQSRCLTGFRDSSRPVLS